VAQDFMLQSAHAQADLTEGLHVERHRNGSVRARGRVVDGQPDGYREWFRLDGTLLRSGSFDKGGQTGEWTTYDATRAVDKVTTKKNWLATAPEGTATSSDSVARANPCRTTPWGLGAAAPELLKQVSRTRLDRADGG